MLGVCYYPEHWPEAWWADDARKMRELGIGYVRIGEFAWNRLEPEPGRLELSWLRMKPSRLNMGIEKMMFDSLVAAKNAEGSEFIGAAGNCGAALCGLRSSCAMAMPAARPRRYVGRWER